jgi:hypothetical protein
MTDAALDAAAEDLIDHLTGLGPDVRATRRLIRAAGAPSEGTLTC